MMKKFIIFIPHYRRTVVNRKLQAMILAFIGHLLLFIITVTPGYAMGNIGNIPPLADDQLVITAENTSVEITLTASDNDGDPLHYSIVTDPDHGILSINADPIYTYTPDSGYIGSDSFSFQADDGVDDSNIAIVTITVNPGSTALTVMINQAAAQADPTNSGPINFTILFSEPVSNFVTGDVTLVGTAGATTGTVTGSGTTYNVAVSGNAGAYAWDGNPWADYSAFMSPITSDVKANLRSIMTVGETNGRVLGRMGQIGDSITNSSAYFRNGILQGSSGNETNHDYSDVRSWMAYGGTQLADGSSFYNAHGKGSDYGNVSGWTLDDAVVANHPFEAVEVGDGLAPGDFSWALIMFGTNDIDYPSWDAQTWKAYYSVFVQEFINLGVVPVLSTIPPEEDHIGNGRVELANDQIKSIATELKIPFVDYYALVLYYQPVAWVGTLISIDGTHPSVGGGGRDFSQNGLTSSDGYAARTKLTWDMAEKLKTIVFEDGASESSFTSDGTVIATIGAGMATDGLGNPNAPSTSTDNTVNLDTTAPVITISGTNPQEIVLNTPYTELGATAFDNLDGDLSGAIIIDISAVDTATVGTYVVTYDVTDGAGNQAVQMPRTVNVMVAPGGLTIAAQPTDVTVTEPNPATFTVVANGDGPITYQWRRNGADLPEEESATLTLPATTTADSGAVFDVVVSNAAGIATSATATLTVNPDLHAPTPTPTWATAPYPTGTTSISMTSTTVSDPSGVEYKFYEINSDSDSGWLDSHAFTHTGLTPNTEYRYQVKARDKSAKQNETGWSSESSATTNAEEPKGYCGAEPMYGGNGSSQMTAANSFGNAVLPLLPSMMALGLWRIKGISKKRKKR